MIAVTGTGRAVGAPDVVRVRAVAAAVRPSVAEALAAAEATAAAIRGVLAEHGVGAADTTSGSFSLGPEQTWSPDGGPRTAGYRCEHELRVTLRDPATLGQVLGTVVAAGGDGLRLDGVEPGVDDVEPLRRLARELAWADAADRAQRLAALAGRSLGPVRRIVEGGVGAGEPPAVALAARAVAADVGVRPGDVEVTVSLHVRWELA